MRHSILFFGMIHRFRMFVLFDIKGKILLIENTMPQNYVNIGGQAVIEGVMMRSPKYMSIAVRKPDGKVALFREENKPWVKRNKILSLPLIRGGVILIESLVHGISICLMTEAITVGHA